MIRITFARHGQSMSNAIGRWQGQSDVPLSDQGRDEALRLARRLRKAQFDLVVASDLRRAADTARTLNRPIELDEQLREIDVGAWEGLSRDEVQRRYGDDLAAVARGEDIALGGGESWREVQGRAERAVARLLGRLSDGDHALVVGHGGWIRALFAGAIVAADHSKRPLASIVNTALCTLEFDGAKPRVARYNDALHLFDSKPGSPSAATSTESATQSAAHPHRLRLPIPLPTWAQTHLDRGETVVVLDTDGAEAEGAHANDARARITRASSPLELTMLRERRRGELIEATHSPETVAAFVQHCFPQSVGWVEPPAQTLTVVVVAPNHAMLGTYGTGTFPCQP